MMFNYSFIVIFLTVYQVYRLHDVHMFDALYSKQLYIYIIYLLKTMNCLLMETSQYNDHISIRHGAMSDTLGLRTG